MALNLVQSASNGASPVVPASSTLTTSVSKTFTSAVTAGNLIIVAISTRNGDTGSVSDMPTVTDSLGNTYTQIIWGNATGTQTQGIGFYYAKNILGGACTVTFTCRTPNGNPLFALTSQMGLAILELSGFGTLPAVRDSTINQTGSASVPINLVLTDSTGTAVTTGFGICSLVSGAAAVISGLGGDYFVAARCLSTNPAPAAPTVTGAAWPYVVQENATDGVAYPLLLAVRTSPVATTAPGPASSAWLVINEPSLGLTDRTPYLFVGDGQQNSYSVQLRQRGQATIHLFVAAGDSYAPTRGAPVYLWDQTATSTWFLVFAGLIQDIEYDWVGKNAGDHYVIITAVSLESVFDTIYAKPVQYVNKTCGYIVTDLFGRFETGSQVTLGTISTGAVIPLLNTNYEKLSDLFGQLATTSEFTWYVDPSTQRLMFVAPSTITPPSPFNPIGDQSILWDTLQWKSNGADYRNRQAIKLSYDAFAHSAEFFVGAGQTDFQLLRPVQQVTNAWATLSTCNTAIGTFSGNPSAGDTVTIGVATEVWQATHAYALGGTIIVAGYVQKVTFAGTTGGTIPAFSTITTGTTIDGTVIWTCLGPAGLSTGVDVYTFRATIDNRLFGDVLIGANATASCLNLVDAINANAAVRGTTFSLPTWECSLCNAVNNTGTAFTIQRKNAGTGWIASLSETSSAFSWSSALTTGGTSPQGSLGPGEGATIVLQVYIKGTSTASPALYYTPGDSIVHLASPLNVGSNLNVEYTRADGNVIEVENTALVTALAIVTHGTGKYQHITDASTTGLIATSSAAGLLFAQEALAAYSVAPQAMEFQTHIPGLQVGMDLPLSLLYPTGATSLLNGNWVIEEINAELVPVKEWIGNGAGHFHYTVKTVNIQEIGSYLDFWEGLGGGSGGGGGGTPGLVATSGGASPTPAAGSVPGASFADNETPSGTVNGSNAAFTLAQTPYPAASLQLYVNGVLQIAGTDYTLATATATFGSAPSTGALLTAFYRY